MNIYESVLPYRFYWYFERIASVFESIEDAQAFISRKYQLHAQGVLLTKLIEEKLWNVENEQIILATSAEELAWMNDQFGGFIDISFFYSQDVFNLFMTNTLITLDEKYFFYRILNLFSKQDYPNFLSIIHYWDVLSDDLVAEFIIDTLPSHMIIIEFIQGLIEICQETQRLIKEDRIDSIMRFFAHVFYIPEPRIQQGKINYPQSIHNKFLEKTCSESAQRLSARYTGDVDFETIQKSLTEFIKSNPSGKLIDKAALRCLARFNTITYTDKLSKINVQQLLKCCWQAIHDSSHLLPQVDMMTAKQSLIYHFYLIQRRYNINEDDQDDLNRKDQSTCAQGTFLFLVLSLYSIHEDVELEFMSLQWAGEKFMLLIKQSVHAYLKRKQVELNPEEYSSLIKMMDDEGIEPIWKSINTQIIDTIFEDFGLLFNEDITHPGFITLINSYKDVDLESILRVFKLAPSEGTLSAASIETPHASSRGFFSRQKRNASDAEQPEESKALKTHL